MLDKILLAIGVFIVLTLVMVGPRACDKMTCGIKADEMGRRTKYEWFSGCLVETKDGWVPLKQMRGGE